MYNIVNVVNATGLFTLKDYFMLCVFYLNSRKEHHMLRYMKFKKTRDKEILKTAGEKGSHIVLLRIN